MGSDRVVDVLASMAVAPMVTAVLSDRPRPIRAGASVRACGGRDVADLVAAGRHRGLVVLAAGAADRLVAAGHLDRDSRAEVADSPTGLAVRSGDPRPSVDTEERLRETLLATRSIGYSTGPSGDAFCNLLRRWGLEDAVRSRLVQAPAGTPVATLLTAGDVDLAVQQLSELSGAGVDVLGPLPPGCAVVTRFVGVATRSAAADPALRRDCGELLTALSDPHTDAVKRRFGLSHPGPATASVVGRP